MCYLCLFLHRRTVMCKSSQHTLGMIREAVHISKFLLFYYSILMLGSSVSVKLKKKNKKNIIPMLPTLNCVL